MNIKFCSTTLIGPKILHTNDILPKKQRKFLNIKSFRFFFTFINLVKTKIIINILNNISLDLIL